MVLGVYLAAWRRWFSLKQQVEELEAGPGTARTQSADLGALLADLWIEVSSVDVEPSMGHRRVQFPDVTLPSSRFPSHSPSFAGIRQLSRACFGAGHERCRPETDAAPES